MPRSSGTTWPPRWTRPARTRPTPSCCSCSSACPPQCSLRCSPAAVTAAGAIAAAGNRPCCGSAVQPPGSCSSGRGRGSRDRRGRWPARLAGAAVIAHTAFGADHFDVTGSRRRHGPHRRGGRLDAHRARRPSCYRPADLRRQDRDRRAAPSRPMRYPAWARYGLDARLLIIAGLVFAAAARNGYSWCWPPKGWRHLGVVLGSGGPRAVMVRRRAAHLAGHRPAAGRGRPLLRRVLRPFTGASPTTVTAAMSRGNAAH